MHVIWQCILTELDAEDEKHASEALIYPMHGRVTLVFCLSQ